MIAKILGPRWARIGLGGMVTMFAAAYIIVYIHFAITSASINGKITGVFFALPGVALLIVGVGMIIDAYRDKPGATY